MFIILILFLIKIFLFYNDLAFFNLEVGIWEDDLLQTVHTKFRREEVGSNPTVYWMDVSDASLYILNAEKE
jgi:hypothetical protein